MRVWRLVKAAALVSAVALVAAGCSGGGGDTRGWGGLDETVVMELTNPKKPLVPGDSVETEGVQIVRSLWTGLVTFDIDTNELEYGGVAESIESTDSINYTVTLKDGWTFHDGTPVTADSFINAWNYTANPKNAFEGAHFFESIKGYEALAETDDASTGLEGLKKIDDTTFTVELDAPFSQWPLMSGVVAYYPLPEAFFEDPKAFGKKPIGNGPFRAETEFVENDGMTLARYENYSGDNAAKIDRLEYRIISSMDTAYRNVQSGEIDVSRVPPSVVTTVETEFGDRLVAGNTPIIATLAFPFYDGRFNDKRVRQAFSMAIDREAITTAVFNGTRAPATSFVPPAIPGSRDDACGYCVFDAERAKALLAETDFDTSTPIEIWYNGGAGHDTWIQAVANQWKQNLGVDYKLRGEAQLAEFFTARTEKQMTGPYRTGWKADFPSMQNFLDPLYTTKAHPPVGANDTWYSNPEFDAAVEAAIQAVGEDEAMAKYQAAEDIVLEDMPGIPVYFDQQQYVHSERIKNIRMDGLGSLRMELIELT